MNATERQTFRLVHKNARALALYAVSAAPDGYIVTVRPAARSLDQNAKLHALLSDLAASKIMVGGKRRTMDEWKLLMIVAHANETKTPVEVVEFEGEKIAIRESSASMSVARSSSLIEYITAYCAREGVPLRDPAPARTGR